ncbi:hypothetical protein DFH06DRAFT_1120449 [Mycena polygramma]|nr:hypothetical protein DFH06DRAFT_1120449 [Mycena polygramma]
MPRSHQAAAQSNEQLDKLNNALRIQSGAATTRPLLRRPYQEQVAAEESVHQKMSKRTKDERAAIAKAAQQNQVRRAKARERMALRRAQIKALPPEEQLQYQEKARRARAKWREENRRYLRIASWDYRNRKFIEMHEAHGGEGLGERTRYEQYITKSSIRHFKKLRAERAKQRAENEPLRREPQSESEMDDDLPDSSEIATSDDSE